MHFTPCLTKTVSIVFTSFLLCHFQTHVFLFEACIFILELHYYLYGLPQHTSLVHLKKKSGNNIKNTHTLSKVPVFFLSANCDASTKNGKTFIFIVLDNNKKQRLFQNDSLTFASGPHTRSFNSTILSLILVRYRFSIKL